MTHVLDTSSLLAHHLAEPGALEVQAIFDDSTNEICVSVLTLLEFELKLHQLGSSFPDRCAGVAHYKSVLDEIVPVSEAICAKAFELKLASKARLPTIDSMIAATASNLGATFIHRDPHFLNIPADLLKQFMLPQK